MCSTTATPAPVKDDAERWSIDFLDNFSGWKEIKLPFASMHRKEIGNGAPNDGFGLTEVHGWALGTVTTPAPQTYYVDNVHGLRRCADQAFDRRL